MAAVTSCKNALYFQYNFVTFYDVEFDQHENEIDENFYQNQDKESKLPRHPCQHLSNKVTKNANKIKVKSFNYLLTVSIILKMLIDSYSSSMLCLGLVLRVSDN